MKASVFGYVLAVASLLSLTAVAGDGSWLTDFEKAKEESAKTGRPILADFSGSDWCGWCVRLDEEVFAKKLFKDYAKDNVILFLADFPRAKAQPDELKKQNEMLAGKFSVRGFPTVLLLDAKGNELARTGYERGGAETYVEHIKSLLKKSD